MKSLYIAGQADNYHTPEVDFNVDTGICILAGESYLEETYAFYDPLYNWLHEFISKIAKPIEFNIKLKYMNTSSSKCLLNMIKVLKNYELKGGTVKVNWYVEDGDTDMEEEVEDIMKDTKLTIHIIIVEEL